MKQIRVCLADDHPLIREGLRRLINSQDDMEVVGEASNGSDAWRQARELLPDVLVTDLSMPVLSGAEATGFIKRDCPETKILVLTVHEDESYLRELLALGASGYVLKRAAASELPQAIRVIAAGGVYLDTNFGTQLLAAKSQDWSGGNQPDHLTPRETEVLRLIAWGHTNKEIATMLHLSVKTVETYKSRILEKLNLATRADLVRYALRHGWMQAA